MGKKNPVLVLASENDPQFTMLNELPHTACGDIVTCAQAAEDATVILHGRDRGICCGPCSRYAIGCAGYTPGPQASITCCFENWLRAQFCSPMAVGCSAPHSESLC